MKQGLVLLVDPIGLREHPFLEYLLSFDGVAGVEVWRLTSLQSREENGASARFVSSSGTRDCWVAPYQQFEIIASRMMEGSSEHPSRETALARAIALSFVSRNRGADGVVSAVGTWLEGHHGLVSGQRVLSVAQALAVVGANVRLRPVAPLGGEPSFFAPRTVVYPRTVSALIPTAGVWANHFRPQLAAHQLGRTLAGTVLSRAAQMLRARDALHEGIRLLEGETAVDEALYHFDVVLTSAMASFDAFARALREPLKLEVEARDCGLQRKNFRKSLKKVRPVLASLLEGGHQVGSRIHFINLIRNQIHGVAPSEVLYVKADERIVEHRVIISSEVAQEVQERFPRPVPSMEARGLFLSDGPTVNLATLTETIVEWVFEVLDAVMVEALPPDAKLEPTEDTGQGLWPPGIGDVLSMLAQVGSYPPIPGMGIPASPATRSQSFRAHAAGMRAVRSLGNEPEKASGPS